MGKLNAELVFSSDFVFFSSYTVLSPHNSFSECNQERSVDGEGHRHHTTGAWKELGSTFQTALSGSNRKYIAGASFHHLS